MPEAFNDPELLNSQRRSKPFTSACRFSTTNSEVFYAVRRIVTEATALSTFPAAAVRQIRDLYAAFAAKHLERDERRRPVTAPNLGPCTCEVIDRSRAFATLPPGTRCDPALGVVFVPHEHSDFEPYPCAEPECPCTAHRTPGDEAEPAENQAQINAAARNRASATIPTGALEFATENVTQTAEWIDGVLAWAGAGATPADDPAAVCDFADALDAIWPEAVDPKLALALTLRRLAATKRDNSARRFVAEIKRKAARL